jgi:hypothetical protein
MARALTAAEVALIRTVLVEPVRPASSVELAAVLRGLNDSAPGAPSVLDVLVERLAELAEVAADPAFDLPRVDHIYIPIQLREAIDRVGAVGEALDYARAAALEHQASAGER